MNFGEAIGSGFSNYVTFRGRSRRSAFWWWQLFAFLCGLVAAAVDSGLRTAGSDGVGPIGLLLDLALFLPGLAIQVRRLHDTDHSGWWLLLVFTIIGIIPLFIWFCSNGDRGPNPYGADPKAGGQAPGFPQRASVDAPPSPFSSGFGNPAPAAPTGDPLARLEQLGRLRDQGVLTEEEFQAQKAKILGG